MSLENLIKNKKLHLKSCKTVVTNTLGQRYEEFSGGTKDLAPGVPFVIDLKPDLQIAYIISGLYLSSQDPAVNEEILREYRIHRILSVGVDVPIKFVNIEYYYCDLLDLPDSDISAAIGKCIKIIHENRCKNILVHCNAGVSRSAAIVISYLMASEKLSYDDAFDRVKKARNCIKPNEGFVKQLRTIQLSHIV